MKYNSEIYYIGNTVIEISDQYSGESKPEEIDSIMERIAFLAKARGIKGTKDSPA